jgi:hypothetical protein
MENIPDEPLPLATIARPDVITPIAFQVYSSPLTVEIKGGSGGTHAAKKFEIDFHPVGPDLEKLVADARFSQALPPGPHQLHTRALWYEGGSSDESPWVFIDWFYVLTPPRLA